MNLPILSTFPHRQALELALELAEHAGQLLLDIHRLGPQRIASKRTAVDMVTEADLASQQLILAGIHRHFPGHGILAEEEGGDRRNHSGALWLVDPLDGTTNFASRFPIFAVSIALWVDGQPQIGVVRDVVRERSYWAAAGQGAWIDQERRLQVSATTTLAHSLIGTGFPYTRAIDPDNNTAEFVRIMPQVRGVRRAGAAALDMAFVADGRLDGYWESGMNPWDWGAGVLLIAEAGGVVSDYSGAAWSLHSPPRMAAANPHLHGLLLAEIQAARGAAGFSLL